MVVLQTGVHPVRIAAVDGDSVHLRDRDVVHADVGLSHVEALVQPAVADDIDVARVRRIDAKHMVIRFQTDVVGGRRRLLLEGRTAILALDDVDRGQPHALVVVGIDGRLAVVHRPRIGRAHPLPGGTGILGPIRAARRGVLDGGDEHVGLRARQRQADASLVAGRDAVLELLPRSAGVDALVDGAAWTAAVEPERLAQALIGRGIEHLGIAWIHHEIRRAGERIHEEHLGPRATRIRRLEDTALGVFSPEVPHRRNVGDIRIRGIEHDAADRTRIVQTEIRPRVAAVSGPVHAAAPGRALTIVVLAGAGPDNLRIALEDRERAEGVVRLGAEHILPGDTVVDRLPDAAARGSYIQDGRILRIDLEIVDASAGGGWPDVAESKVIEGPAGRTTGLGQYPRRRERERYGDADESNGGQKAVCDAHDGGAYATAAPAARGRWRPRTRAHNGYIAVTTAAQIR